MRDSLGCSSQEDAGCFDPDQVLILLLILLLILVLILVPILVLATCSMVARMARRRHSRTASAARRAWGSGIRPVALEVELRGSTSGDRSGG